MCLIQFHFLSLKYSKNKFKKKRKISENYSKYCHSLEKMHCYIQNTFDKKIQLFVTQHVIQNWTSVGKCLFTNTTFMRLSIQVDIYVAFKVYFVHEALRAYVTVISVLSFMSLHMGTASMFGSEFLPTYRTFKILSLAHVITDCTVEWLSLNAYLDFGVLGRFTRFKIRITDNPSADIGHRKTILLFWCYGTWITVSRILWKIHIILPVSPRVDAWTEAFR